MVFSQTSLKTRNLLKVVELDRLKPNKNQQANGLTGVITDGNEEAMPSSPAPTTSFSEDFLKPEPLFDNTMFPQPDYEFFHALDWSSAPVRDEQAQTTDMSTKKIEERANTYDTKNTPFSPLGWEANSPLAQTSFYGTNTPKESLSPIAVDGFSKFDEFLFSQDFSSVNRIESPEEFLNIGELPVVIEGMSEDRGVDNLWSNTNTLSWPYDTHTTQYYKHSDTTHTTMPFIHQEDSLNQDLKFMPVIPGEIENDMVISEYILDHQGKGGALREAEMRPQSMGLSVDLMAANSSNGPNISTPDVVNYVEQLEKEKSPLLDLKLTEEWSPEASGLISRGSCSKPGSPLSVETRPATPKDESQVDSESDDAKPRRGRRRQRTNSEDSDKTYTPELEYTPVKNKRRRHKIPIKDMIRALEGSQKLTKARRGRPPIRRDSALSSVGSIDDSSSNISSQDMKYRRLRDKNNEASKRSRMNRKLKELQMEQLADELEEQNKKLKIRASILEEMTIKLKNALMAAMTQK